MRWRGQLMSTVICISVRTCVEALRGAYTYMRMIVSLHFVCVALREIQIKQHKATMNRTGTSVEPARTTAYSRDIGWRVVWQKLGMSLTCRQIAQRLQIALGTAHRIFKRFINAGDVSSAATARKGVPCRDSRMLDKYHELYILCLISETPGLYVAEICQKINDSANVSVSRSTVCRLLKHNGCSRKMIVQVAKQQCLEYRGAFMAEALRYRMDMFVFVDESGSDRRDGVHKFGYSIRTEAAVCKR